eukprot:jgi/Ulvmu1/11779/UM008_0193.1
MRMILLAVAALVAFAASAAAGCGQTLMYNDFNKYSGGFQTYTKAMMQQDWPAGPSKITTSQGQQKQTGLVFLKFDYNSEVGEGVFRAKNPQGCYATGMCGSTFDVRLPSKVMEATVSYKVKFDAGYAWGLGGKLPGLCSDDCPSGCTAMNHGTGFSARAMWREGGDLMSYMYYAGMDGSLSCGEDWHWGKTANSGGWMDVEMYVKLNTPGVANGVETVKVNGQTVYNSNSVKYIMDGKHGIEKFTFRSFHGGSSPKWASPQTQYIYFDDMKVQEGNCVGGGGSPVAVASASGSSTDTSTKTSPARQENSGSVDAEPRPSPPPPPAPSPPPPQQSPPSNPPPQIRNVEEQDGQEKQDVQTQQSRGQRMREKENRMREERTRTRMARRARG